jgi:GTP-binding protein
MKILTAVFELSAYDSLHMPGGGLPEIAFLGRSNVGKSSLLNSLLGRRGLARTSNTPGRTQSINFFLVNDAFYFVDLPGYGYAKVSKAIRSDWGRMARDYLTDREGLAFCIQLVDSRHSPTVLDRQLNEWLVFNGKRHLVVATKADKLSANQLRKQLEVIEKTFAESRVMAYSAVTGKGKDELWTEIAAALKKNEI